MSNYNIYEPLPNSRCTSVTHTIAEVFRLPDQQAHEKTIYLHAHAPTLERAESQLATMIDQINALVVAGEFPANYNVNDPSTYPELKYPDSDPDWWAWGNLHTGRLPDAKDKDHA